MSVALFVTVLLLCFVWTQALDALQHSAGTSEPMRVGGEVSAPKLMSRGKRKIRWPDPTQCYQLGVAVFEGVIDKTGAVRDLKLTKGPDNEFTRARREELLQDKYSPGRHRGKPVDVKVTITVSHMPFKRVEGAC